MPKTTPKPKNVTPGNHKLIGKNYITPDLMAKVTGQAKYAEDYRADGMLFCKLLLSPVPHGRVKRIDTSAALAMPGVKAIITMDDLPAPADIVSDSGAVTKASKEGERGLTMEPMYEGEPILAVAAVDELTAAEAIEKIRVDYERLPFVVDPLESLRPGGPNARTNGNVWMRPPAPKAPPAGGRPAPPPPPQLTIHKWTEEDFAEAKNGRLPMGKVTDPSFEWSYGDVEAGFKNAALVLDETFVTPNTSHQCLETRSALAYWQNGKLFMHTGTQSTVQTVPAIARWMNMDVNDIVFISEYTGGGFGSKVTAGISLIIPAILSKKTGMPVMMRLTREEEHYIGRARPSFLGRMKVGFAKDGRITALDMFAIQENGPYELQGDISACGPMASLMYQPPAMRFRGIAVLTNTPPRTSQSAPGGYQPITLMEPVLAKAARKLGVDQVALRRINAPEGKAEFGPPVRGKRQYTTSAFIREALDMGKEQFRWDERIARPKRNGAKVRGVGVAMSTYSGGSIGFDGLFLIKPDGVVCFQSGIGNLGTESVMDVHRVAAEMLGVPWEKVDICWGNTSKHLPWSCIQGGSSTTHAMTRAAHAVAEEGRLRLCELAAKKFGGRPEDYVVANERVSRKGGGAGMTLAQASQYAIQVGGIYDGHEVNPDVNKFTKRSVANLAGQGFVAAAKDKYPRDGQTRSFCAAFAEVEVDVETGKYHIVDFTAIADVGTILHPHSLGGQVLGRSTLGIGHAIGQKWVYDQHYGLPLAKRFHHNKPPTILDVPVDMQWDAVNLPDPETPVGARGIGEPPVGAGCCAILNALSDALGDEIFRRAPVTADVILAALEAGRPVQNGLTAHI